MVIGTKPLLLRVTKAALVVCPKSEGWKTIGELMDATGSAPVPLSGIVVVGIDALEVKVNCPVYV